MLTAEQWKELKGYQWQLIDCNWCNKPSAWCDYYEGYLTRGLMKTHQCQTKKCRYLVQGKEFEESLF